MIKTIALFILLGGLLHFIKMGVGVFLNPISNETLYVFESELSPFLTSNKEKEVIKAHIQALIDEKILFKESLKLISLFENSFIKDRLLKNMKFLITKNEISDDELLKKALKLNMLEKDQILKRFLIQHMKNLIPLTRGENQVTASELKDYFNKNIQLYSSPAQIKFSHHFFKKSPDIKRLKKGEPFHLGEGISLTKDEICIQFGEDFCGKINFSKLKDTWSGPYRSQFGHHLILVDKIIPRKSHSFELIKDKLRMKVMEEKKQRAIILELKKLRKKYHVQLKTSKSKTMFFNILREVTNENSNITLSIM